MNKQTFYKDYVKPELKPDDRAFNRQLFNDLSDGLCKDGTITQKQYNEWRPPNNKLFYSDSELKILKKSKRA